MKISFAEAIVDLFFVAFGMRFGSLWNEYLWLNFWQKAMSFDVQWDNVCNDAILAEQLRDFLNSKLSVVDLPHYLSNLQVVGFKFGDKAPEITIRDINVPFDEFYDALREEEEGEGDGIGVEELHAPVPQPPDAMRNVHSIPLTPRREGSPFGIPLPSPGAGSGMSSTTTKLFAKNPFLMPRNNSGMGQMRQFGVGLANFGVGGGVGTPGVIGNSGGTGGAVEGAVPLDYSGSSTSHLESESDYFQQNESYNKYNDDTYNVANESITTSTKSERDRGMDIQFSVDIDWDSQIYIEITCDLLVNYPALEFIRLPVRLKITDVKIHSLLIIAYIAKRVFISFLCDIDDDDEDTNVKGERDGGVERDSETDILITAVSELNLESRQNSKSHGRHDRERKKGKDRIDIIQDMNIEGEIGSGVDMNGEIWSEQMAMDADGNGLVLRNIGKIENFLLGTLRNLLIDELGWPDWIELDFNESDEEEINSEEEDEEVKEETVIMNSIKVVPGDHTVNMEQALVSDGETDEERFIRANRRGSRRESRLRRDRVSRPDSYGDSESAYSHESYFTSGTDSTGTDSDDGY